MLSGVHHAGVNMVQFPLDPNLAAQISNLKDTVAFTDSQGKILGYFHPVTVDATWKSSISREELERRRQERGGRPLRDVINDLLKQQ
jgi:hypothetical protein